MQRYGEKPSIPNIPSDFSSKQEEINFSNQKTRKKWHFSKMPPHSPSQKKGNEAQNKPPQTSSRQKRQIPQADTQNTPQPTKQSQRKNISRFSGPTMRMESVPEGTPSLPFFKNWCFKPWKSTIYKTSKIIHFLNKVNILYNHLIFNNINFCPRMLSNSHLFTICKTLSVENNLIG